MTDFRLEPQLLARAQAGEPEAVAELYDRFGNLVYRVALRMLASEPDAEDVVQDVFVALERTLKTYEGRGSFEGWLKRVASRTALMKLRRERVRSEVPLEADYLVRPGRGSPADRISLENAIRGLPESLRVVFILKEVEGYSHEEIGRQMGINVGTSKIRLYRARRHLQRTLGDGK